MASKITTELIAGFDGVGATCRSTAGDEYGAVLDEVREICATYGFTATDVFPPKKRRHYDPAKSKTYRHPETGEVYRGRGKPPKSFSEVGKEVWRTWAAS